MSTGLGEKKTISMMKRSNSPKGASNNNNNSISSIVPLVRSRTAPLSPTQGHQHTPQRDRCNSGSESQQHPMHSDTAFSSNRVDGSNGMDPDDQEQALFEQRLCEDIYGVAVRKINQNGKSNLRYVKCLYIDATDVRPNIEDSNTTMTTPTSQQNQYSSSSRSVSSRHSRGSRGGFSRFLSGSRDRDRDREGGAGGTPSSNNAVHYHENDVHRSLLCGSSSSNNNKINHHHLNSSNSLYNGKVQVLSWGKKKDVTVPLDQFTAVLKGKKTDRSKRNPYPASRIVSLITTDIHSSNDNRSTSNFSTNSNTNYPSLDIEAPTRLDRDKFALAFARFLKIPLLEEGDTLSAVSPSFGVFGNNKSKHSRSRSSSSFPQQQTQQLNSKGTDRSIRSNKSDMSPQSWKGMDNLSLEKYTSLTLSLTQQILSFPVIFNDINYYCHHEQLNYRSDSRQSISIPDIALTTSNSHTTNASRSSIKHQQNAHAPLPVVTTRGIGAMHPNSKPPRNNRRSINNTSGGNQLISNGAMHISSSSLSPSHQSTTSKNNKSSRNGLDSEVPSDPPLISLHSSSLGGGSNTNNTNTSFISNHQKDHQSNITTNKKEKMMLEIPNTTTKALSSKNAATSNTPATSATAENNHTHSTHTITANKNNDGEDDDAGSIVSSITGAGFDQDLVEELHLALERMKAELEESRAEASRAVKVAEQAIQSAENSNSKDWNNTVTHKAAEAAATAQKKSAEAMAKARKAEERLQIERKASAVRKRQVEIAEQQAAHWQTRAVAAEVQRFAVAEALESERKKNAELLKTAITAAAVNDNNDITKQDAFDPFDTGDTPSATSSRSKVLTSPTHVSQVTFAEVDYIRSKLAMEMARRRQLLDELQDLRGAVRVYCRPRAPSSTNTTSKKYQPMITLVSNEVLLLRRNNLSSHLMSSSYDSNKGSASSSSSPLSFEFDGILPSDMSQIDIYSEFEAMCSSVMEGYKICLMTYGQANSGKTHTLLGEVHHNKIDQSVSIENHGVHLRSMEQLFSLLELRSERFKDNVTLNLVEVHDERLVDLLAGTDFGEAHGRVEDAQKSSNSRRRKDTNDESTASQIATNSISSSRPKLEIKTTRDGETAIRGVLSVEVSSFKEILCIWKESLALRSKRLAEQDMDYIAYEQDSHIIATLKVSSKNLATGACTFGRMQFVDFASSEIAAKRSFGKTSSSKRHGRSSYPDQAIGDWKFTNKSLNVVRDVVRARTQYQRSVPYRNSTITHILSDSLEADTKVVMIACVSSDDADIQNTTCTLRFAQEMRKVIVGKATRHNTIAIDQA